MKIQGLPIATAVLFAGCSPTETTETAPSQAAAEATAGANPLRYNIYKLDLIEVAVRRALLKAAGMEELA